MVYGMKHTLTRTPNKSEKECRRGHQQELPEFRDEIAAGANGSGDGRLTRKMGLLRRCYAYIYLTLILEIGGEGSETDVTGLPPPQNAPPGPRDST